MEAVKNLEETPKPFEMDQKSFNQWKQEQKRVRDLNEQTIIDLRQQAEHEKLTYELGHYRLLSIKDLIERSTLIEAYDKAKEVLMPKLNLAD